MIKLAAAGVKVRTSQPRGVLGHAARAAELFAQARVGEHFLGLPIDDLLDGCRRVERMANVARPDDLPVRPVFDFVLWPHPVAEGAPT